MINVAIGAIPSWLGAAPLLALAPLATLEIARQSWLYRTAPWPPGAAQRARARELLNLKLWPLVTHTFVQLNLKATVGTLMETAASTIGLDSDSRSIKTALTQAEGPGSCTLLSSICTSQELLCSKLLYWSWVSVLQRHWSDLQRAGFRVKLWPWSPMSHHDVADYATEQWWQFYQNWLDKGASCN